MQKPERNKALGAEDASNKAASHLTEDQYHFAGEGIYLPQTVTASSLEEATEKWKATRVKVREEANLPDTARGADKQ